MEQQGPVEQYVMIFCPADQPDVMEVGWFTFYDASFGLDDLEYRKLTPRTLERLTKPFLATHQAIYVQTARSFGSLTILYPNEATLTPEDVVDSVFIARADAERKMMAMSAQRKRKTHAH